MSGISTTCFPAHTCFHIPRIRFSCGVLSFFSFSFFYGVGIYIDTMPLCQCPSNAKRDMISNFTTSMRTRSLQMLIVVFGGFISMQPGLKRWRKAGTKPSLGLPPIKNVFSDNVCINNNKNTSLGLPLFKDVFNGHVFVRATLLPSHIPNCTPLPVQTI